MRTFTAFGLALALLGLAIAQSIAARHGGTITVASHLGHGTTFTVTLPATEAS